MKYWVRAAILPVALAASLANAQTGAQFAPQNNQGWNDRAPSGTYEENAQYDMARVIRVQRVNGYSANVPVSRNGQRCYTDGGGYASNDGYNGSRNDRYGNSSYGNYPNSYGNGGYNNNGYNGGYNNGYNNGYGYPNNRYGAGGSGTGRTIAGVVGSVVGAVVGSQIGGGSGRYLGTAVGSVLGGVAGTGVYDNVQRSRQRLPEVTVCDPVPVGSDPRDYNRNNGNGTWYDVTYEYRGRTYTDRLPYDPGRELRVRVDVRPI